MRRPKNMNASLIPGDSPIVAPGGRIIAEHLRKRALPERIGELELTRVVEQGDAALSFYRLALAA